MKKVTPMEVIDEDKIGKLTGDRCVIFLLEKLQIMII